MNETQQPAGSPKTRTPPGSAGITVAEAMDFAFAVREVPKRRHPGVLVAELVALGLLIVVFLVLALR